jgi:hypothetical protein
MADKLSAAVEELESQLAEQLQEVAGTKKLINSLLKRMGQEPRYTDVSEEHRGAMRADEYYGKPLATAAQMYLERRHQAVSGEDILRGLEQGGFNFKPLNWSENAKLRNLVISLVKNSKAFHRLPNGTFGLTSWYDAATVASGKRVEKEQTEASDAGDQSEQPAKAAAS